MVVPLLFVACAGGPGGDFGGNVFYENRDGALVDASDACGCAPTIDGMSADVGDYDRDGLPDLFLAASVEGVLLRALSDGTWLSVGAAEGLGALPGGAMSWSGIWLDYDNDGALDLLTTRGDLWGAGEDLPRFESSAALYRQGSAGFQDVAAAAGLDAPGSWRSALALDWNGYGVLDPLVTGVVERPRLYLSDGCTAANWLSVRAPVGSRVEVSAGGGAWTAWIDARSGFGAAGPPIAHLGLGAAPRVERLRVILPDGEAVEATDFAPRRAVEVHAAQ